MNTRLLYTCSALLLFCAGAGAVSVSDFLAGSYTHGGTTIVYRLFVPYSTPAPGRMYPIVLALHGVGERGSDNSAQLGNHIIDWADETRQAANASFVLVPQCPSDEYWVGDGWGVWASGVYTQTPAIAPALGAVMALLDSLVSALPVDLQRQYVTGLSMGGDGNVGPDGAVPRPLGRGCAGVRSGRHRSGSQPARSSDLGLSRQRRRYRATAGHACGHASTHQGR